MPGYAEVFSIRIELREGAVALPTHRTHPRVEAWCSSEYIRRPIPIILIIYMLLHIPKATLHTNGN